MKKKVKYNKLIRDKIPEIIKAAGWSPVVVVLGKKKFLEALKKKVLEEAKELAKARRKNEVINEIVDLQEILDTLISELGLGKREVKKEQVAKKKKRGGFRNKLFLIREEK